MQQQQNYKSVTKSDISVTKMENKHVFYVVRKRSRYNEYHTILCIDKNGSFRGPAVFYQKEDAETYMEEYSKKLVCSYLKEGKGSHGNAINRYQSSQSSNDLRVFCESSYPDLRNPRSVNVPYIHTHPPDLVDT
jgi:hypothetical protein